MVVLDKGYSWVILSASFITQFAGIGFSVGGVGIMTMSFSERFPNAEKSQVSWIGSLRSFQFLAGPLAVLLIKKFGCRAMTICGAVLSGAGIAAAAASTEIWQVYLSYGVVAGIGVAFTYTCSSAIIGEYFDEKRNIAFPIACLGNSLGVLVFPYMLQVILDNTGHTTALYVTAALKSLELLCGFIFKTNAPSGVLQLGENEVIKKTELEYSVNFAAAEVDICEYAVQRGTVLTTALANSTGNDVDILTTATNAECRPVTTTEPGAGVTDDSRTPSIAETASKSSSASLCSKDGRSRKGGTDDRRSVHRMLSLLQQWQVWMLMLNALCWGLSVVAAEVLLPIYVNDHGLDQDKASLGLTVIGGGMLVSSLITLAAGSRSYDRFLIYGTTSGILGALTISATFSNKFEVYFSICSIFGFVLGLLLSLFMSVLAEFGEAEHFADYFGLYILFNGAGAFCGPALIGAIQTAYGDDIGWYTCGGIGILGSVVLIPLYALRLKGAAVST